MNRFRFLWSYLVYALTARHVNGHDVHSPLVFEFITELLEDNRRFYSFSAIEAQRSKLLASTQHIQVRDFGAGANRPQQRRIATIARRALVKPAFGQLYFKMINHYKSLRILELGTSLGISSAYLATANSKAQVISLEGCPETAAQAAALHQRLGIHNVAIRVGNFSEQLKPALESLNGVDFVYFDGNHQYQPTVDYFEACLPYAHSGSVFVFDDIRWSSEMRRAWQYICSHHNVVLTIDLFFVGLVFFKAHTARQHFVVKH